MRVLLDANILISYLLKPDLETASRQIVDAAILGRFTLLLPEALLDEFSAKVQTKKYLADRISLEEVNQFVAILSFCSESIPTITQNIPAVTRDPKDDYLLAYALVGQADYLVTGDKDLLTLTALENVQIVTPAEFAKRLSTA